MPMALIFPHFDAVQFAIGVVSRPAFEIYSELRSTLLSFLFLVSL
jgi:hypothetical protein